MTTEPSSSKSSRLSSVAAAVRVLKCFSEVEPEIGISSLAKRLSLTGFVMCEQVKSLDFRSRHMKRIESAPKELLDDALALIDAAIF